MTMTTPEKMRRGIEGAAAFRLAAFHAYRELPLGAWLPSPVPAILKKAVAYGWWLTSEERAQAASLLCGHDLRAGIAMAAERLSAILGAEQIPPPDGGSKAAMDSFLASFDDAAVRMTFERLADGTGLSSHERLEAISDIGRSPWIPHGSPREDIESTSGAQRRD